MNATLPLAGAELRRSAGTAFFESRAEEIAGLCHLMAGRFARGGRLLACGEGAVAASDVRHVTVEFVHPVIVGKRALPALALLGDRSSLSSQMDLLAEAGDMVIAFGEHPTTAAAVGLARARGCLTIADSRCGAEWELAPPVADPFVRQELFETLYHVLWELVHVFFEHRGLLEGRPERTRHDAGAARFLYPFLDEGEEDLDGVLADVRESVLAKSEEISALRAATLAESQGVLAAAAAAARARLDRGGRVLAIGNGGSATDAMDAVADLRTPPPGLPPRAAIDLTEDPAILTAIANDIGTEAIFSRQLIAHGRELDVLIAFSTSGGSDDILLALRQARAAGLLTVAFAGYGGGQIAAEGLADHVIVTRSEHIPRIQEAQASAWHVLRELLEDGDGAPGS